ncbi:reverse transcriptase domain-containing protein [Tanacetum coccineum]
MKDLLRSCHGHGLGRGTTIQIFYHGLDEATQAILDVGGIFLYKTPNEAYQLLKDRVLLKLDWFKDIKAKPIRKTVAFAEGPHPSSKCDDKPTGGPGEEANYAYRGYRGNYYARNYGNWRGRQPRDDNRTSQPRDDNHSNPLPTPEKKLEETEFKKTMREFIVAQRSSNEYVKNQFFNLKTKVEQGQKNHQDAIQDLETKFGRLSDQCSTRPTGSLPSNTQTNPKPSPSSEKPYRPSFTQNGHVNAVSTCSGKTYDPPVNPNDKTIIIHDDNEDEVDEAEIEEELSSFKPTKTDPAPLKSYKQKIPYPQCLYKEKMVERYAKFIDMIKEVRINVPLVDVLAGMPNYGKFLKDLVSNKSKMEHIFVAFLNEECFVIVQNKLPPKQYQPHAIFTLRITIVSTLKPTRMSIRLANHTYQYPMGVAENMLVQVGKFVFPVDFVILEMKEDSKVPLILGRQFIHTADAIIRVKSKELNLGVGDDIITFLIDKAMHY